MNQPQNPQNVRVEELVDGNPVATVPEAAPPSLNVVLLANDTDREIRAYATPTFNNFSPIITLPEVKAAKLELKLVMFQILQKVGQFYGHAIYDPHMHLRFFMDVCNLFKVVRVTKEVFQLKLFPYSLGDEARTWLNSLPSESVTSWNDMAKMFLMRYFSPRLSK